MHQPFQHSYQLPSYLSYANLEIYLKADFDDELSEFTHYFEVNQDAEPMVTLKLETDKKWTTDDSVINGKVTATYRWGAPYVNRKIDINAFGEIKIDAQNQHFGFVPPKCDEKVN